MSLDGTDVAVIRLGSRIDGIRKRSATYYHLTKPERTYANVMTAGAGFLLAAKWHVHVGLLLALLVGMSLLVASACVLNNYIDRDLDTRMPRTKKRALPKGEVPARNVLVFTAMLGGGGMFLLAAYVNWLVVVLGLAAYFDYIVLYGIFKRRSVHGTLVGTVSGSIPMVGGYCAVTGRIDAGAIILYLTMTFWQMAHFFAIAIYRMKDYAAGGIPVLPIKKGVHRTKVQIMLYAVAFTIAAVSLSAFGYTGYIYATVMGFLGCVWLWRGYHGFKARDDVAWARMMFLFSLKALLLFSLWVAIGGILP